MMNILTQNENVFIQFPRFEVELQQLADRHRPVWQARAAVAAGLPDWQPSRSPHPACLVSPVGQHVNILSTLSISGPTSLLSWGQQDYTQVARLYPILRVKTSFISNVFQQCNCGEEVRWSETVVSFLENNDDSENKKLLFCSYNKVNFR